MMSPLALALAQRQPEPTPTVAPTDVLGAYKMSGDQAMEKYKADTARSNAMWGGVAGLGGAGLLAFAPYLAPALGLGAAAAAPAAGMAGSAAIPWLAGSMRGRT